MPKKSSADNADTGIPSAAQFAGTVRDSAQQIWLAGLGAFTRAQQEGGKVFDNLVKDGMTSQRRSQGSADDPMTEAASKASSFAADLGARATGQWDKLETIFDERVGRATARLGMPSALEWQAMVARLDAMEKQLAVPKPAARRRTTTAAAPAATKKVPKTALKKAPKTKRSATAPTRKG